MNQPCQTDVPAITRPKRLILGSLGALIAIFALCLLAPSGRGRYRADSRVLAQPDTNALRGRSFEARVIQAVPDVLRLRVSSALSVGPFLSTPNLTNGVLIQITALGATPEDARRAANEAASQVCRTMLTNYGGAGRILDSASAARRYSYFRDQFVPEVVRLFER